MCVNVSIYVRVVGVRVTSARAAMNGELGGGVGGGKNEHVGARMRASEHPRSLCACMNGTVPIS